MPTLLTWWSGALVASSIDARRADLVTSCSIGHRRGSWFKERGDGQPGLVPLPSRRVPEQRAHRKFSGGSGCSPEDLPTTDFGESLDLKQPGARATEQPLTQTEEVQLERQGRRNAFAGVRMVKSSEIKLVCGIKARACLVSLR
ncbi:uncharacterized protein [Dermacentor andersoni]|uniref:uncharacterized protein n=1 Tax=Dermacentor andersoni TaxID=34620 RepID=UPI003B3AF13B